MRQLYLTKCVTMKVTLATTLVLVSYGDMIEMGILDPTKVTRTALQARGFNCQHGSLLLKPCH